MIYLPGSSYLGQILKYSKKTSPSKTCPKSLSLFLLLMLALAQSVAAFGELGHQLVAAIAQDLLTPKTKLQVESILKAAGGGGKPPSLIQISVWADKVRSLRPETAPWHYVNLQLGEPGYDEKRTIAPNIVTALENQWTLLGQGSRDRYVREEALKWVVHLVGDLHQPLHVGEDQDKGGNLVLVKVNRRTYKLHEVWDFVLLERLHLSLDSLHSILIQEIATNPTYLERNGQGTVRNWVNATHARTHACYNLHGKKMRKGIKLSLDRAYVQTSTLLVLDQIKLAGIRLAVVLNKALDPEGSKKPLSQLLPALKRTGPNPLPEAVFRHSEALAVPADRTLTKFLWSANSQVYHLSDCAEISRIKPKNLRKGNDPPPNLHLHLNCPIRP